LNFVTRRRFSIDGLVTRVRFEFLFDFPGGLGGGIPQDVEEMSLLARALMTVELGAARAGRLLSGGAR
jgi:hypothetical protein